jgi:hypothetical protein
LSLLWYCPLLLSKCSHNVPSCVLISPFIPQMLVFLLKAHPANFLFNIYSLLYRWNSDFSRLKHILGKCSHFCRFFSGIYGQIRWNQKSRGWDWGCSSVVECLPSMCKALSSIPCTVKVSLLGSLLFPVYKGTCAFFLFLSCQQEREVRLSDAWKETKQLWLWKAVLMLRRSKQYAGQSLGSLFLSWSDSLWISYDVIKTNPSLVKPPWFSFTYSPKKFIPIWPLYHF